MRLISCLSLLLLISSAAAYHESFDEAQRFSVGPVEIVTMTFELDEGDQIFGSIFVSKGDSIDFTVEDSQGNVVMPGIHIQERANFSFTATDKGAYLLVFDNAGSFTGKEITIYNLEFEYSSRQSWRHINLADQQRYFLTRNEFVFFGFITLITILVIAILMLRRFRKI